MTEKMAKVLEMQKAEIASLRMENERLRVRNDDLSKYYDETFDMEAEVEDLRKENKKLLWNLGRALGGFCQVAHIATEARREVREEIGLEVPQEATQ